MELNESTLIFFKKELTKFAQIEKDLVETQSLIKPLQNRIKKLKLERKALESNICTTMDSYDIRIVDVGCSVLEYKVKNSIVPLTQKTVKEKMIDFFEQGPGSSISFNSFSVREKGEELFNYIYAKDNRTYVKKESITSRD